MNTRLHQPYSKGNRTCTAMAVFSLHWDYITWIKIACDQKVDKMEHVLCELPPAHTKQKI